MQQLSSKKASHLTAVVGSKDINAPLPAAAVKQVLCLQVFLGGTNIADEAERLTQPSCAAFQLCDQAGQACRPALPFQFSFPPGIVAAGHYILIVCLGLN